MPLSCELSLPQLQHAGDVAGEIRLSEEGGLGKALCVNEQLQALLCSPQQEQAHKCDVVLARLPSNLSVRE